MLMINRFENDNDFTRAGAGLRYRHAVTAVGARTVAEGASGMNRAYRSIKTVPFNGLLTNRLLTELPGEDFARLLPHLEPVSLSCGERLYRFGEDVEDVYFPEGAVVSHLYVLADGSTT